MAHLLPIALSYILSAPGTSNRVDCFLNMNVFGRRLRVKRHFDTRIVYTPTLHITMY